MAHSLLGLLSVVPAKADARVPNNLIPPQASLEDLRHQARLCQGCDIWQRATQVVFGEGPQHAEVMFVGEQPGNREDLEGRPFVGPAGQLFDNALAQAGIERGRVYVTNVVKHFNSIPRGKLRIHKKPNAAEIAACRPWLEAEIAAVAPQLIVCLGATAAQALIGRSFRVSLQRSKLLKSPLAPAITATVHPSSILRTPDKDLRHTGMMRFIEDLRLIAQHLSITTHMGN